MAQITPVTRENYESFIREKQFAVIHFDAFWDVGHRPLTRLIMLATAQLFPRDVNFGEVDCDADLELCERIPVANLPLLAYFRDGSLVAGLIGSGQNIAERLRRVMRGNSIGYRDGTDLLAVTPIDEAQLRRDQEAARLYALQRTTKSL